MWNAECVCVCMCVCERERVSACVIVKTLRIYVCLRSCSVSCMVTACCLVHLL